jgi:NADH-quinone oxidoreductase subunit I
MATRVVTTPLNVRPPVRERAYLFEVVRGMGITISHFLKNIADLRKDRVGITWQWPEQPQPLVETLRAEHRLMQRTDGTPRCVACNCCATACPANCIEITGADTGHDGVEKFPVRFDIDILQCVYCGLCVEACPCDAIRMDTGKITAAYFEGPIKILDIDYLLKNHPEGKSPISEAIY